MYFHGHNYSCKDINWCGTIVQRIFKAMNNSISFLQLFLESNLVGEKIEICRNVNYKLGAALPGLPVIAYKDIKAKFI